jgi:antirestriction protein
MAIENKTSKEVLKLAKEFKEENDLDLEINIAYIENIGIEYASAEDVREAYQGEYESDEDFAMEIAEECGEIPNGVNSRWPLYCIDWEQASRELMYDYFESNGYYFRNL